MLEQLLGFSRSRTLLATALLVVLGACKSAAFAPAEGVTGYLEVLPARAQDATCDAAVPGHLQLSGVVDGNGAVVSGEELCKSHVVRRELPAGLYAVSWQASDDDEESANGEHWALRGPSVVSVFPDQVTRLRVRQVADEREVAARTP